MKKLHTQKPFASIPVLIFAIIVPTICGMGLAEAQTLARPAALSNGSRVNRSADKSPANPFEPAEELVYVAEFSRAVLKKVDVADFRFTAVREPALQKVADPASSQNKSGNSYLLKLTGDVSSRGFFSKLFNLHFRERVESIVEPASFTVQKTKRVDEQGKRARISESIYKDGKVLWTERDPNNPARAPRQASATFAGSVQDILSAIYYLRTQPLEVGKTFEITISDSGVVYQVPVKVVGQKRMKTALGRVETLRVDPEVFGANRLLSGEGHFSIWLTNDNRRVPVSARIKTKYGTFDITLRKVIKNPTPPESLASTNLIEQPEDFPFTIYHFPFGM
jgi:hypothetical protein